MWAHHTLEIWFRKPTYWYEWYCCLRKNIVGSCVLFSNFKDNQSKLNECLFLVGIFHFQKHSKEIFCHLRRKNCKQSEVITFLVLSFFWPAGNSKLLYESIFFSLLINFRMILQKNTFWGTCMSNIAFHLLYYSIHVYNISYWFAPQMGIASKSMGPVILALNYMMKVLWIIYLNH